VSERSAQLARLLRGRYVLYVLVVLALLVFRVIPTLRSRLAPVRPGSAGGRDELVVCGLDTAPELIARIAAFYRGLYPEAGLATRPGGTVTALEDLLNRRADVAFISRPPSALEDSVIRSAGDSLLLFPVALGGTLVLAPEASGLESLSVAGLKELLSGRRPAELPRGAPAPQRVYVPDPGLGLWGAVARQLGLPEIAPATVLWLQTEPEVAAAVAADPASIGLASSLVVDPEAVPGCRLVRLTGARPELAADPTSDGIAGGEYPLYHHLYAACRVGAGARAAGFASFVHGEAGQTLIRREGFLPAREIAREIQLAQRPVGMRR
jgi:ABC-type phosphate transport system substrate-binding protein